jgi:hypothetical protein
VDIDDRKGKCSEGISELLVIPSEEIGWIGTLKSGHGRNDRQLSGITGTWVWVGKEWIFDQKTGLCGETVVFGSLCNQQFCWLGLNSSKKWRDEKRAVTSRRSQREVGGEEGLLSLKGKLILLFGAVSSDWRCKQLKLGKWAAGAGL